MGETFKPTISKPMSVQSQGFERNFNKTMKQNNIKLNEVDELLSETEFKLKKKIFSLPKMEALIFSDPKLSAIYEQMVADGAERYGYHFNETVNNLIFNDYVLNSPKYLQKYKQAIPVEKKRRDKSGINQLKKAGEEKMQTRNLNSKPKTKSVVDELNSANETTGAGGGAGGAFSGSGQYSTPLGYDRKVDETTGSASSGAYVGPAVWGSGDLMKTKGKAKVKTKPIIQGGTIIGESEYLIDPSGFVIFIENLNEQSDINFIRNNSEEYGSVNKMNSDNKNIIKNDIKTGQPDQANLKTMEEGKKIDEKAKSKSQQKFMGMVHAVQTGKLSPNKVGNKVEKAAETMKKSDAEDFASTKHKKLPEKIKEDTQTMIQSNGMSMSNKATPTGEQGGNIDMGTRSMSMNESEKLLEEINNELDAFSIHHNKLKRMAEDRKPSALVLRDRVGSENEKNFKKDLQHSGTKEIIDVEKELQYKDQQTEIGDDPQKLGADIEKQALKTGDMKSGEALKNVGDSTNDDGDEIPKRNLTNEEQDEVNNYRLGLGDFVYDNEPGKRFEDRMKADMGDKLYKQRQDKLEFRGKAPMYNKEAQPTENTGIDKVQFDKEKTGWNERVGIKEGMVTGKFFDNLGKKRIVDFNLNEVTQINSVKQTGLYEVSLDGLGNTYTQKVSVNENVVKAMNEHKFYTDGSKVYAMKNPVQKLNENEGKNTKPIMNEQLDKMKHLLGYKPETFTDTNNVKKNRGF